MKAIVRIYIVYEFELFRSYPLNWTFWIQILYFQIFSHPFIAFSVFVIILYTHRCLHKMVTKLHNKHSIIYSIVHKRAKSKNSINKHVNKNANNECEQKIDGPLWKQNYTKSNCGSVNELHNEKTHPTGISINSSILRRDQWSIKKYPIFSSPRSIGYRR